MRHRLFAHVHSKAHHATHLEHLLHLLHAFHGFWHPVVSHFVFA